LTITVALSQEVMFSLLEQRLLAASDFERDPRVDHGVPDLDDLAVETTF